MKLRTRRRILWAKTKRWLWTRDYKNPSIGLFGCRLLLAWESRQADITWFWRGRLHMIGLRYGQFDNYERRHQKTA